MQVASISNISFQDILSDQNMLNALFNLLKISWFAVDKNGKVIIWNTVLINIVEKMFPGRDLSTICVAEVDEAVWNNLKQIMHSNQMSVVEEQAPNGNWYLSVKSPLVIENIVEGIIGIAIDITDKKQAEIAKDEFLANMGHDLRTPFSGLLSLSEYLEQTEQDSGRKELLGDIVNSANRLLKLLNQVLEVSLIGSHSLQITDFDIHDIIDEIKDLMMAEVKHKNLELVIACPNKIISNDRMRLSRIMLNLVGNAVKYTAAGKITIMVSTEPKLKISVADTGKGIPTASFDTIFKKFSRLESGYKEQNFNGSGIGLHITKEFAKDLGGDILVESEVGVGSKFTFCLN